MFDPIQRSNLFQGKGDGTILIDLSNYIIEGSGFYDSVYDKLDDLTKEVSLLLKKIQNPLTNDRFETYMEMIKQDLVDISAVERKIREVFEVVSSWESKHLMMANSCISNISR